MKEDKDESAEIERECAHARLLRAYIAEIDARETLPYRWPDHEQDALYGRLEKNINSDEVSDQAKQFCLKKLDEIRAEWIASAEVSAAGTRVALRKLGEEWSKIFTYNPQ